MKTYTLIIIAILLFITSCNWSKQQKPLIEVSVIQLLDDYSNNELTADEKYKDRIIEITGDVANVSQIRGTVGVLFEDYNPSSKFYVLCLSINLKQRYFTT